MAVDMFLKMTNDIKGESADNSHKEEIDVLAWSWGSTQSGTMHTGTGGGAGKASFQDLSITKWVDLASPMLIQACASGQHITQCDLVVRKAGGNPLEYLQITMKDCLISSYSTGGSGSEDRLTENISINFGWYKVVYKSQNPDGTEKGQMPCTFNIAKNIKE